MERMSDLIYYCLVGAEPICVSVDLTPYYYLYKLMHENVRVLLRDHLKLEFNTTKLFC